MKRLPEPLQFKKPLRDVRCVLPKAKDERAAQLQAAVDEAFERGRREGEKALSEQLIRQRAEVLTLQNGVLQSIRDLLPQLARECESTLVTLAIESAQKMVSGMPISAELMEATVREALARVEEATDFTVLLHSEDLELLQRFNSPVLVDEVGGERIRFRAASEVTRGGCMVQTRFGTIDARRETKLEMLKRSLEVS